MKNFHVADLNAKGELLAKAVYDYEQLERIPGAGEVITEMATAIWRSPEAFEAPLMRHRPALVMRWRASAPTAGIATLRAGERLASVSLLASGKDAEADHITLDAFQRHLLTELRDTGYEPAFALMDLRERPLVATFPFESPAEAADQLLVALADRCFAAAYFRYLGLA